MIGSALQMHVAIDALLLPLAVWLSFWLRRPFPGFQPAGWLLLAVLWLAPHLYLTGHTKPHCWAGIALYRLVAATDIGAAGCHR